MWLESGWRHARKRWSWEFEDFKKKVVEIEPLKTRVEFSTVETCSWVFQISTDRDLKHHKTRRALGMVSIVRILSLASCRLTEVKKLINCSYLKQQNPPVSEFVYVLYYCCDWHYGMAIQQYWYCFYEIHHHHYHVVLPARISLTLSRLFSLSFIASGRSSGLHPVSSHSYCMYIRAGRPAFARPCAGIHRNASLMSSSLLLQQCPACLVRLTWIVFVMGGRWPYSWCLVGCCRQDLFNIAHSILV